MGLPVIDRLKKELEELRHELNSKLPKELEEARAHGDLRENAEYEAAKERQGVVNARIGATEQRIRELSMINVRSFPEGAIGYGSLVTLTDEEDGGEVRYEIVLPEEVDAGRGKISLSSPLGRALLNKQPGDEVQVQTPRGSRTFSVLALTTIHDREDMSLE
jgi:transcription elongation factor GreA